MSITYKRIPMSEKFISTTAIAILSIFLLISGGCKKGQNNSGLTSVTGRAGELVIVISNEAWNGSAGDSLFSIFTQPQVAIPQREPLFNIINIPPEGFGDIFKTSRNIIITNISPSVQKSEIVYRDNVYANTQAIVTISAKDNAEFTTMLTENSDQILSFFLKAERNRLIGSYRSIFERAVLDSLSRKYDITLNVFPGFTIAEDRDNFTWIKYETPEISQGIFVYELPYESDSTFTSKFLMTERIKQWRKNVPGPLDGSYMTNENQIEEVFNIIKFNGNYAAETRNLWTVENDYMGGPYISLAVLDMLEQRVVVVEGYVYAPSKNKRNLIRQIEAMIYTLKFNKQADIDKINKQYEE